MISWMVPEPLVPLAKMAEAADGPNCWTRAVLYLQHTSMGLRFWMQGKKQWTARHCWKGGGARHGKRVRSQDQVAVALGHQVDSSVRRVQRLVLHHRTHSLSSSATPLASDKEATSPKQREFPAPPQRARPATARQGCFQT